VVGALWGEHPRHPQALDWVVRARQGSVEAFIAQHALAETFAVLTGLPISPRLQPVSVRQAIEDLLGYVSVVPLAPGDYRSCINELAMNAVSGRAIYDYLHLWAAEAAGVDCIATLNAKDFLRFCHGRSIRVVPV